MGFWGKLGGALKMAAPFVAAPFTGGASLALAPNMMGSGLSDMFGSDVTGAAQAWDPALVGSGGGGGFNWGGLIQKAGGAGNILRAGANVAGSVEQGRESGRDKENAFNLNQDVTRLRALSDYESALENRQGIDLKQRQFGMDSQNNAYNNAMKSALGMNMQDVSLGGVPGNIPKINFSGGLRPSAMGPQGREASRIMNQKAMASLISGEQFDKMPEIERFTPSEMKKGNALDTILGTVGAAGKAVEDIRAGKRQDEQAGTLQQLLLEARKQGIAVPQAGQGAQAPAAPQGPSQVPGNAVPGQMNLPSDPFGKGGLFRPQGQNGPLGGIMYDQFGNPIGNY